MTMQNRIGRSLDQAKSHYTVLVVGSGYGAGVAASRLARAGQDVCILERGKEMLPGEYPNKLSDAQGAMQFNIKQRAILAYIDNICIEILIIRCLAEFSQDIMVIGVDKRLRVKTDKIIT